ncbi:MAG: glycoside hydrolase family 27 protein, partial [Rhodanobacter sp.]
MAAVALAVGMPATAQQKMLAPTPPMGWNSWDSYGLTINESEFRANVDALTKRLKPAGYQYAVVDEGWYLANPQEASKAETLQYRIDANGRYEPALDRFATAKGTAGFKPVADYVHTQGLKFGIHIIRGITRKAVAGNMPIADSVFHAVDAADTTDTCPWNSDNVGVKDNAAGQAWYDALMQQYASWGVDYIKVDCIASHPYKGDEIRMIHRAIVKTGRPMVLSLSPGPAPLTEAVELGQNAQLWRISNDVWDHWEKNKEWSQNVKDQFAVIASWAKDAKPGNWPDADMLPLGRLGPVPGDGKPRATRLTRDEQRSMVTLWSIARSPLFFGGNLTELDHWTQALLTNPSVVAMDQRGQGQRLA